MKSCALQKGQGWIKYIWLVYLIFFLGPPIFNHAGWRQWIFTGLGLAAFLIFYFGCFYAPKVWKYVAW